VNSDAILVLDRGKVAAVGRHDELLESCDIYSGLWHQQNRHVAAAAAAVVPLRGGARD
jgi:ATP-binding cassette subfamily B protein